MVCICMRSMHMCVFVCLYMYGPILVFVSLNMEAQGGSILSYLLSILYVKDSLLAEFRAHSFG